MLPAVLLTAHNHAGTGSSIGNGSSISDGNSNVAASMGGAVGTMGAMANQMDGVAQQVT